MHQLRNGPSEVVVTSQFRCCVPIADCDPVGALQEYMDGPQSKASRLRSPSLFPRRVLCGSGGRASHHERNSFEHEPEARFVVEIRRWWQACTFALRWSGARLFVGECYPVALCRRARMAPGCSHLRPPRLRLTSLPLQRANSISSRHLGNEMDLAGSEGSEGMKIDNIKPHVSFHPKHFSVGHEQHTSMLARSDVDKGCAFVLLASSVPEKVDRAGRWKGSMSLTSLLASSPFALALSIHSWEIQTLTHHRLSTGTCADDHIGVKIEGPFRSEHCL